MDIPELKKRVCQEIDSIHGELNQLAHELHKDPEVGWETPRSVARIGGLLESHGMEVQHPIAGLSSAFRATTKGRRDVRPAVAFLAEYDALEDIGHGCGHNLIAAVASGAGIAVSRVLQEFGLEGSAHVMGCPFEEGGGGKVIMVDKGVFDDVDASLMWHAPNNPSNRIVVGNPNNAAQSLKFTFHGKASHAAANPEAGINALNAVLITFNAVNALRQHLTTDVRVAGIVTSGGQAANVVPSRAEMVLSVRARTRSRLTEVCERVKDCAQAGALATGTSLEIEEGHIYMNRIVLQSFREIAFSNFPLLGLDEVREDPQLSASADSGNVSHVVPHLTFRLPITDLPDVKAHTPEFAAASDTDQAREAIAVSAKLMALCAIDLLTKPGVLLELQNELQSRKLELDSYDSGIQTVRS